MHLNLEGQVVVVTGAFGVLGKAVALEVMRHGGQVAMLDRAEVPENQQLGELKGALQLGGVDLTSLESAEKAVAQVVAHFGGLGALVNVAGGFAGKRLNKVISQVGTFSIRPICVLQLQRARRRYLLC